MIRILKFIKKNIYTVPWCVPAWGWEEFCATCAALHRGEFVHGPHHERVADAIKRYLGLEYALPVNRGRTAIELALRALPVGEGDDVVLPSYLCHSVLDAVVRVGGRPIFADVGPDLNVTLQSVMESITPKTKCVIVAHLFGKSAPIDEIEKSLRGCGIALIDDAAQATGARRSGQLVGTFGTCGIIACGPGKPLAGPAGGLLVTNDGDLYRRALTMLPGYESAAHVAHRVLSFWVWRRFRQISLPLQLVLERLARPKMERPHQSCALSDLDAAIILRQLSSLEKNAASRRRNASLLAAVLEDMMGFVVPNWSPEDVAGRLVLILRPGGLRSAEAIDLLAIAGIESQKGYLPLHFRMGEAGTLPQVEAVWDRVVWIPIERPPNSRRLYGALRQIQVGSRLQWTPT